MDAANDPTAARSEADLARFTVEAVNGRDGSAPQNGVVIAVSGELDAQSGSRLRTLLAEAFDGRPSEVVVDLSEVGFIDSVGLSVLVTAHNRGDAEGIPFLVRSPSAPCQRVFDITRLVDVLRVT